MGTYHVPELGYAAILYDYLKGVKMYVLDPNLASLNRIFDQNKREGYLRLDLNENPGGLPQEFIDKVLADIDPEVS